MKQIKLQLRCLIAEKLMSWAYKCSPAGPEGDLIRKHLSAYSLEWLEGACIIE